MKVRRIRRKISEVTSIINKEKNEKSDKIKLITDDSGKLEIGSYEEVAKYIQDNEYIKEGYLLNCNTIKKSLKSLFVLHNESVNIWTHFLGTLFFIFLIFYTIFFITNYQTQIKIIKSEISETTRNYEELTSNDKYLIENFIVSLNKIKSNLGNIRKLYNNSYYELNQLYYKLKNINTFPSSIKNFITDLTTSISSLSNELLDLIKLDSKYVNDEKNIRELIEKKHIKNLPRWPLFIMIISTILCLSFSTCFHAFGNISAKYHVILNRFDYGGISLLISGSCYPPYYFLFYFSDKFRWFYLVFISVFGIGTFLYSLTKDFNLPKRRTLRGILFLIFGISAGIPIAHMSFFGNTIIGYVKGVKLLFWYIGGISYIVGALLYILRFPEKKFPGKFDYFGASHQIFHVLVFVGAFSHFIGSIDSYYYRFNNLEFKV